LTSTPTCRRSTILVDRVLTAYLHGHRAGWFRQEGPKVVFEESLIWPNGLQMLSVR
jgi:hypothetical protein